MTATGGPSTVRFEPSVAARLARFVSTRPGLSTSAATNLLVDEALRSQEHPLVVFRDGPAGRRARLVGGPDVWEVATAIGAVRAAEPALDPAGVIDLVTETTGVETRLVRAGLDYWTSYPDEIEAWIERARTAAVEAENRWHREQALLGR